MKFLTDIKNLLIIGLIIFLIVLVIKPCGKEKALSQYRELKHERDSLKNVIAGIQKSSADQRKTDSANLSEANKKAEAAASKTRAAESRLSVTQGKLNDLVARHNALSNQPVDSSFVSVPVGYKENCEEMAAFIPGLQAEINTYKETVAESEKLLQYEKQVSNDALEGEKKRFDSLMSAAKAQSATLDKAISAAKPRGRFLAGAGILGNQTQFISGAKIALAYQTRGGKQYQAGAAVIHKEIVYEGTVLITLFK